MTKPSSLQLATLACGAAMAIAACSNDHGLQEETLTPIDQGGGVATSADGLVSIEVEADGVSTPMEIRITTRRDIIGEDLVSLVYEFGPDGLTFDKPVRLRMPAWASPTKKC